MKKIISAVAMICLIVMLFSMGAEAAKPYQTYTYSINREPLNSPDAYTPILISIYRSPFLIERTCTLVILPILPLKMKKFKHHVYVSYDNMNTILKYFPNYKNRSLVCNNMIDYKMIREEAMKPISLKKTVTTFVNVGRHEEHQKRLSRIIDAADRLKREGYQFQVWLVGDGVNHKHLPIYKKKEKQWILNGTCIDYPG